MKTMKQWKVLMFCLALTVCAVVAMPLTSAASIAGGWQYYGYTTTYFNQDGYNDQKEMYWAYYLGAQGISDYAWLYAYYGMGLDLLTQCGIYSAVNTRPTITVDYQTGGALGWASGLNITLNSYYLQDVTTSNWWSVLGTYAYWEGSVITHEISHSFFSTVTGKGIYAPSLSNNYSTQGYWNNLITESVAHYVGNVVWPYQYPTTSAYYGFVQTSWQGIARDAGTEWGYSSSSGFSYMGNWSTIASAYNFGGSYTRGARDHFWALGFFMGNYYDYKTGYTGAFNSSGYLSPLSAYGYGGSWNIGVTLYYMKYYTAESAMAAVYGYTPVLSSMSTNFFDTTLNSKYYYYWWGMRYYAGA